MNKAARVDRAKKAARARWDAAGVEERQRQHLAMLTAQAAKLGYRLVPVDEAPGRQQ